MTSIDIYVVTKANCCTKEAQKSLQQEKESRVEEYESSRG